MESPPGAKNPWNLSGKPRKGPFQFSVTDDSDTEDEGSLGLQPLKDATQHSGEKDIFDQAVEDTIHESETQNPESHNTHSHFSQDGNGDESLFVTDQEVQADPSRQNTRQPLPSLVKVKSEPGDGDDDDSFCIVIDKSEAPAGAQGKWAEPRDPWIVDLTDTGSTHVKKEPKTETMDVDFKSAATTPHERIAELQSKATSGAITSEDFEELSRLFQLSAQPKAVARAPKPSRQSELELYWGKREVKDRKKRNREREKKRKRRAEEKSTRRTKKAKASANPSHSNVDRETERQIDGLLHLNDAIQDRADRGDLPAEPTIKATRREDQLKQMEAAAPEDLDKNHLKSQKTELHESTKAWGRRMVASKDGRWEIKGVLRTTLLNHQIVVGAWMLGRECRPSLKPPRGGILADAMGLGKTIETLSCIAGHQPSAKLKESGKGATLVVCPSGQMIGQWMAEVKQHCMPLFSKEIVHYKPGNKMDIELLASLNIVFASYSQVRASVPSAKMREEMKKELVDPQEYQEWLWNETGDLHRIEWFRVVLDEAHAIKNHLTHSAVSCFELKAKHRWAVSGTPLINDHTEFFSYFKFIRCPGINHYSEYLKEYDSGVAAKEKRNRLVYNVMYRRTQNDWFLGQPILNLPTTHPTHQHLKLSAEETVIFRMAERCFRRKFNFDLRHGIAETQVRSYLTMILRLRQAATHPFLLEGMMAEYLTVKDLGNLKKRLAELKGGQPLYNQIGTWPERHNTSNKRIMEVIEEAERLRQKEINAGRPEDFDPIDDEDSEEDSVGDPSIARKPTLTASSSGIKPVVIDEDDDVDSEDEVEEDSDGMVPQSFLTTKPKEQKGPQAVPAAPPSQSRLQCRLHPFGRSDFGLNFDMDDQLEYLEKCEELILSSCIICMAKPPIRPVKGECGCISCTKCLLGHTGTRGSECHKCGNTVGVPKSLEPFISDDDDTEPAADANQGSRMKNNREYGLGFDHNGFQQYDDDKKDKHPVRFLQISDKNPFVPVTPSAKLTALKETVLVWQKDAPEDKIIIFSQFSIVMKVIGRMLEAEGIPFAYLSGKQNTEQRAKAVDDFQKGDIVKVLIVSLRAGGQCLNLTRGNRVILMELWWNHAVEQQAFARVFRIGQIKETHFLRFIVDTKIEKRMLGMQVSKILAIDAALQDDGVKAPKVDVEDIAQLLGKVTRRNGTLHVSADYSDGEDDEDDEDDPEMPGRRAARRAIQDEEDLEGFVVPDEDGLESDEDDEQDDENGDEDSDDEDEASDEDEDSTE